MEMTRACVHTGGKYCVLRIAICANIQSYLLTPQKTNITIKQLTKLDQHVKGLNVCHFLNKLRQLHEDNVRRTDDELGGDGMEVKLGIS